MIGGGEKTEKSQYLKQIIVILYSKKIFEVLVQDQTRTCLYLILETNQCKFVF